MPTAVTKKDPTPSRTFEPLKMKGSSSDSDGDPASKRFSASLPDTLGTRSLSPVALDSSQRTLYPSIRTPSTGMTSPASSSITSPTTRS
jgi:hypothetical protein